MLSDAPVDAALRAAGYVILQSRVSGPGRLYRLRPPARLSTARALADLAQRFPRAEAARNTLCRAGTFICSGDDCAAHAATSWPAAANGTGLRIGPRT